MSGPVRERVLDRDGVAKTWRHPCTLWILTLVRTRCGSHQGLSRSDGNSSFPGDHTGWALAGEHLRKDIAPGETVTTYVVFTAPKGVQFSEVRLGGTALLSPR